MARRGRGITQVRASCGHQAVPANASRSPYTVNTKGRDSFAADTEVEANLVSAGLLLLLLGQLS